MITLVLHRDRPLGNAEIARLPNGCSAVLGEGDVVARARLDAPLAKVVAVAAEMARAVPDARLEVVEHGAGDSAKPGDAEGRAEAPAGPPVPRPWALLDEGRVEEALALFAEVGLDSAGRDRVRTMIAGTDPEQVALGCRVARAANWRSAVQLARRVVHHGDVGVRVAAVEAIGALGGPGMVTVVRPLLGDPSPEVRRAAEAAMEALEAG